MKGHLPTRLLTMLLGPWPRGVSDTLALEPILLSAMSLSCMYDSCTCVSQPPCVARATQRVYYALAALRVSFHSPHCVAQRTSQRLKIAKDVIGQTNALVSGDVF